MKKIIGRSAAMLCAAAVMLSCAVTAFAEAEDENTELPYADTILPSGITVAEFSEQMDELDRMNDYGSNEFVFASAEVGVFRGDDTLFTGYYGKTDYKDNIPADENSVYEWGSIGKTLIWVSVMQLWEQGMIDLDRDIREYLPADFFKHLSYDDPITMQNLMDHTAGWQETVHAIMYESEDMNMSLKEGCQLVEPAQVNRPGEVVAYSNYGAAVAAYAVECITGTDFTAYVNENILKPLGMEHTTVNRTAADNPWVMEQRRKNHSYGIGALYNKLIDYGEKLEYIPIYPAGAAIGTLDDLMTFGKALVNDDAPLFKNKSTQEKLFSGSLFYGDSDIPMWSNGFMCQEMGVRTYGHTGGTNFGQSGLYFDLESKTGVVVFVNEKSGNSFLGAAPMACFGMLDADKYGEGTGKTFYPSDRSYVISRSWHKGMFGYLSYISSPRLSGRAVEIANGAYKVMVDAGNGTEVAGALIGVRTSSDGRLHICQPSTEAISDSLFIPKLMLLTVYALTGVAAFYMLRIRRKLKKNDRPNPFAGGAAMTAAHIARSASVILLLTGFVLFYSFGGVSFGVTAVLGIAQAVCLVLCVLGAVWALISAFTRKESSGRAYRIVHAFANILCAAGIVIFELYRFTGI